MSRLTEALALLVVFEWSLAFQARAVACQHLVETAIYSALYVMLYVFRKTGNDGKVEPENEIFYLNLSFKILSSISEAGPTLC